MAKYAVGAALAISLITPLYAYELVLKNGQTVHFEKYHVEGQQLYYLNADGKECSISLSEVDIDRTREMNVKELPPLELPGITQKNKGDQTDVGSQTSLGEIARRLREKGQAQAPLSNKRTFTNDDVEESSPWSSVEQDANGKSGENETSNGSFDTMRKFFDLNREDLGRAILSMAGIDAEIRFPERSDWEFSLYDAKQEMVRQFSQASAHPNDVQEQKLLEQKRAEFEAVRGKGIQQARDYAKYHQQ